MSHVSHIHRDNKKLLTEAYYVSRIFTATLIVLVATLFPPFDTSHLVTQPDRKFGLASALLRWDVFHFANVAMEGYRTEPWFAFFPGIPGVMRVFAEAGLWLARVVGLSKRDKVSQADVLLGGALATFVLCDWTSDLYDLTIAVGGTPSSAKLATLLSLIPLSPPTLLFAPYAEPFFATLSYKGMLACQRRQWTKATVCFMLSTAFRSNGMMLVGFLIWGMVVDPLIRRLAEGKKPLIRHFAHSLVKTSIYSNLVTLPFIFHQLHGYYVFCTPSSQAASFTPRPWCSPKSFPLIYSYVQKTYWDVGLLNYWRPPQIPNFMFAAPVMALLFTTSWGQLRRTLDGAKNGWEVGEKSPERSRLQSAAAGVIASLTNNSPSKIETGQATHLLTFSTLPHAIHCFLFSTILLLNSHVQIVLRLSSSMPYTYWAAASLIIRYNGWTGPGWNWGKVWTTYVVVWAFVSMVLWAAFLPPA